MIANYFYSYQLNHFTCWSKAYIHKGDATYHVLFKYTFNGGDGVVSSVGQYTEPNVNNIRITQNPPFTYYNNSNEFLMLSKSTKLTESDAKLLDPILPDFYIYEDRGFQISIFKEGDNGLIFSQDDLPIFICNKQW